MGLIIGFSGVDGSGKTTVAKALKKLLEADGDKVLYHHEIDFVLLRPLFRLASRLIGRRNAENLREDFIVSTENGRAFISDIYYLLVLLDNLCSYVYFRLKRGIVIHDRWLYDFATFFDHKNYSNRLVRKIYLGFPRPDIYVLLTVPKEVSFQRKQGESGHEHHDLTYYEEMGAKAYENAVNKHCDGMFDSNRPVDDVAADIFALIKKIRGKKNSSTTTVKRQSL